MKRLLTYCLLAATLVLGAVALYATACEDAAVPTAAGCDRTHSCPDHNTLAFDLPDQAGIPAGLNRAPHFRTPTSLTREETGSHHWRTACCSQLISLQLYTTRTTVLTLHAEREKAGYYLYTLRKLLI